MVEACLLGATLAGLSVLLRRTAGGNGQESSSARRRTNLAAWCILVSTLAIASGYPALRLLSGLLAGFEVLLENFTLGRDVLASSLFGGAAAALAWLLAASFLRRGRRARLSLIGGLALPGLLGPLVLGLAVLTVFQLPGLATVYDTPLPLTFAQTLILLPLALLLRVAVVPTNPDDGVKLAEMLFAARTARARSWSSRITWYLRGRRLALAIFLLFCWGYYDLTAASLLAPSDMTPVFVRLYNLMHYGESAVLSAMVVVVMTVPILLFIASAGLWRLLSTWRMSHG
jgi:ABC-type Fe3+ transport system permease subunit